MVKIFDLLNLQSVLYLTYCKYCYSLTECYYTFNYKDHLDPGLFFMLHLLNYFLRSAVYNDQLNSARNDVYHDQLVGVCYTPNILS